MGWASETSRGVTTITGPIGDPLAIQIVAEFVGNIEFDEHVWICQIRRTVLDDEAIDLVWREDATEVTVTAATVTDENPTGQITTLSLLFDLEDTTVLDGTGGTRGRGSSSTATRNALLSVRAELDKLIEG